MSRTRRFLLAVAWGILGLSHGVAAWAQEFPSKPVHVLVGFAAGGPTDILARLVGERLSQMWQQPVVVENRAGAGGMIALEAVTRAPADGYTVGVLNLNHVVAQELLAKPSFSIEKDLVPVIGLARQGNVLVVNPSIPARNTAELISYVKSMPGKVSYASGGNGSPAHLAGELFKLTAGVDMTHVPYKGAAPGLQDVAAGHVALMFAAAPPALQLIKAGKLRALAVTSDTRMAQFPDLPTLAESGIAVDVRDWQGLVVPAGTPGAIVSKLNADVLKVLGSPDFRARVLSLGGEVAGGTPADFAAQIRSETLKWRKVVKEAKISGN
ncbi:MAG TPA: tripartite tricarboxylate transporter substrate binding protein [Ramlibacter sp.]|jgi:tripartite-type tricarboxylate transporter receptor subunit TctC